MVSLPGDNRQPRRLLVALLAASFAALCIAPAASGLVIEGLTVTKAGTGTGTVTATSMVPPASGSINCGPSCNATYVINTVVTVTATPDSGSSLASITGCDGGPVTPVAGQATSCMVTMDDNKTVTATFDKIPNSGGGGGGGGGGSDPDNRFTFTLQNTKLLVTVASAGAVTVNPPTSKRAATESKRKKSPLKPSSGSGGPGAITVKLRLRGFAKAQLRQTGKLKVKATITFTPKGGKANSQTATLNIETTKKH